MLLVVVALATHIRGLPYGELPPQLQTRQYKNIQNKCLRLVLIVDRRLKFVDFYLELDPSFSVES